MKVKQMQVGRMAVFAYLVDADNARSAGIRAFMVKPLTKGETARTIRNVLDSPI